MFAQQNQTNRVKNFSKLLFAFLFLCAFLSPLKASAATYYYTGANGTDWSDPASWCYDSNPSCESVALEVPGINDDVYIYNQITSNSGDPASVNSLVLDNTGSPNFIDGITVTVANGATVNNNSYISTTATIVGNVTFNGSSNNASNITGNVVFNGTSYNDSYGAITGNVEFRDSSANSGTITGDVSVYYPVVNPIGGSVSGTITYYNYPRNLIFNGSSLGNETDWGDLANWYDNDLLAVPDSLPGLNDNVTIAYYTYGVSTNSSGVTPEINSLTIQPSSNPIEIGISLTAATDIVFTGASFQSSGSTITAPSVAFENSTYFEGTINGDVYIGNTDYYAGGSPGSNGVYHVSANSWMGVVNGNILFGPGDPINLLIFENNKMNNGGIPASTAVQFDGESYNTGRVEGDAYFNTNYYYYGGFPHPEDVFLVDGRVWSSSVGGVIYKGTYDSPTTVTSFHFINNSTNETTINLPVTFSGPSSNTSNGTINTTGDVIFNGSSSNIGTISAVNVQFNNDSFAIDLSSITVSGNVTINSSANNVAGGISGNVIFNNDATPGTYVGSPLGISGNATFVGDYSEFTQGTISGTKTRLYNVSTTTTRDFTQNGPWTVVADGSGVIVDVSGADYDGTTTFDALNGGAFSGYIPPPRNLTFTGSSDHNWANLDNWYDTDLSTQAASLPTSSDNVTIEQYVDENTGGLASVKTLTVSVNGICIGGIPVTVSNGATFSNGSCFDGQTLTGNVTFETGAYSNDATIIGNVTYTAGSYLSNTQITGTVSFTDVDFSGSSSIVGTTTFNGVATAYGGTITGNAFFNNSSSIYDEAVINGNATFNGDNSEFTVGPVTPTISGTKTRLYASGLTTTRDFTSGGPWIVVADGATVDVVDALYDETTTFSQINGGSFIFPTHTLSYSAGANGSLTGSTTQIVVRYNDGSAVTAVPDSGYYFVDWSDASTDNPRTDLNASGNITVTANFAFSTTTPTVTTSAASSITTTTATLNGNITATGGANATVQGFNYGLSTSYTATTTDSGSFSTGTYSLGIESLTCGTTYHFRAFATNTAGTSYGSDETLTTSACAQSSTPTQSSSRSSSRSGSRSVTTTPSSPIVNTTQSIIDFFKQLFSTNPTVIIPDTTIVGTPVPVTPSPTKPANLTSGSVGGSVTLLQSFLIEQGSGPEAQKLALRGTTGYFGALTKSALIEYQKAHGIIPASGYFGPLTKAYLEKKGIAWWE